MAWRLKAALTAAATAGAILSMGAGQAPAPAPAATPAPPQYYLAAGPNAFAILPPAPVKGTTRYDADRRMFRLTRKIQTTDPDRWALALNDDNSAGLIKGFSCAVGVELTRQNAPKFMSMVPRIGVESARAITVKDTYKRLRPFLIDKGPTCIDQNGPIKGSYDYPSGHNTFSWAVGLILAELVPDRANEILVRARVFGESRLVCGVHNMSAVEAGRTNGSILTAALHGSPEFRADLDAARAEIAAARKAGPAPDAAMCAKEQALSKSPY
jgi:acid phosphatase (class A)